MQGFGAEPIDASGAPAAPGTTQPATTAPEAALAKAAAAPPVSSQPAGYPAVPAAPTPQSQAVQPQTATRLASGTPTQEIASGLVASAMADLNIDVSKITALKQGTSLIVSEMVDLDEQALDLASLIQLCAFDVNSTIKIFDELENLAVELKMGQSAPKLSGFHVIQDLPSATADERAAASCMLGYGIRATANKFPVVSQPLRPQCWAGTKLGAAVRTKMGLTNSDQGWHTVGKLGVALVLSKVQAVDQFSRDKLSGQVALKTLQALDRNVLPKGYCPYLSTITHLVGEPLTSDASKKFAAFVIRMVSRPIWPNRPPKIWSKGHSTQHLVPLGLGAHPASRVDALSLPDKLLPSLATKPISMNPREKTSNGWPRRGR